MFHFALQFYEDSCGDITDKFPPDTPQGVSSCILMSEGEPFQLYAKTGYDGLVKHVKKEAGDKIEKYTHLVDFDDKASSLRKV